jgi:hypothetical protein
METRHAAKKNRLRLGELEKKLQKYCIETSGVEAIWIAGRTNTGGEQRSKSNTVDLKNRRSCRRFTTDMKE